MTPEKKKIYLSDGEGPVVFKDLARDISQKRLPKNLFDITSMWVACDSQKSTPTFEPGDTLAVIVPHLAAHDVTDEDLIFESRDTTFAPGVVEHLQSLQRDGNAVAIISTAYNHLWSECSHALGLNKGQIHCSDLNLISIRQSHLEGRAKIAVLEAEENLQPLKRDISEAIADFRNGVSLNEIFSRKPINEVDEILSDLHFSRLPQIGFCSQSEVKIMGGATKARRIAEIVEDEESDVTNTVFVGDSITDGKALRYVRENGGLAIAVNADKFAIENANVAIGTSDMREIGRIVKAWALGNLDGIRSLEGQLASSYGKERSIETETPISHIEIVREESVDRIAAEHSEFKIMTRGKATPVL